MNLETKAGSENKGSLRGKGALVTGGSRGLGAALGRRLASEGMRVVLVAREERALLETVASIRALGLIAHGVVADIGAKEDVHRIAGAAAALVGPIDLLVHNASTLGTVPMPLLLDTECEDFERTLAVNLLGPFRLTKIVAGSMAMRGEGTVVHVSSDAAVSAYARWGQYGVSKAALDHLNRVWAEEAGPHGVRFVSVDPGEMNTRMHADALPEADVTTLADPDDVARSIVTIVECARDLPNGARFEAARFRAKSAPHAIAAIGAIEQGAR